MEYHITDKQKNIIASFKHEGDRDDCLGMIRDRFEDCEFEYKDGEL